MKNNEQSGFILMIVVMIAIVIFVVGFAVYRISNANSSTEVEGSISNSLVASNR